MTETVPVTFTLTELWLLQTFIRHEMPQQEMWKFPPADIDLNEQIAFAIATCEDDSLASYTFLLNLHQLLCIDFHIRDEYKTITGARGKDILLKVFRARRNLSGELPVTNETTSDLTYKQAKYLKGDS